MMRAARAAVLVAGLNLLAPGAARAYPDDVGARPLGMGQAGRADARGTDGLALNPAGMSLATLYAIAADYQFLTRSGGQTVRVAVADSTSAFQLGGGFYYAYRTASPMGVPSLGAHEVGLALSYPFVDRVYVGITAKYLRVSGGAEPDGATRHTGFTGDVGLVIRPTSVVALGVTGYNLLDRSTVQAPVMLGYGLAVTPRPDLSLALDVVHDFTTSDPTRAVRTSVGGGGELVIKDFLAVRAGGGRDGASGAGFVSGGLAGIAPVGALDASVRQDISGDRRVTTVVFGLRLFVESPQPTQSQSGSEPSSRPPPSSPSLPPVPPPGPSPAGPPP
jgi:hypothetical protein